MKRGKKVALAAALFSAAMSFSACDNAASGAYGPPLEDWNYETENETEADTENENTEEIDSEDTDTEENVSESTDTEEAEE